MPIKNVITSIYANKKNNSKPKLCIFSHEELHIHVVRTVLICTLNFLSVPFRKGSISIRNARQNHIQYFITSNLQVKKNRKKTNKLTQNSEKRNVERNVSIIQRK